MNISAYEIDESVRRNRIFKISLWVVLGITPPGIAISAFLFLDGSAAYNQAVLPLAWFFVFLGLIAWILVAVTYNRFLKSPNVTAAFAAYSEFKKLRKVLRDWVEEYRRIEQGMKFASSQIQNCQSSSGALVESYGNGVNVFKFELTSNDEVLGSLSKAQASFSDNTAVQTYVSSSNTSGRITQQHGNPERFDLNANTTNRLSTIRTGQAYVEVSGPSIMRTVLTFSNPNEGSSCCNLVNRLALEYETNLSRRSNDLAYWLEVSKSLETELNEFIHTSSSFRSHIASFNDDVIYREYSRNSLGTQILSSNEIQILRIT